MCSRNSADKVNDSSMFRLYEYCALFRVILLTSVVEVLVLSCYFKLCSLWQEQCRFLSSANHPSELCETAWVYHIS